MSNKRYMEATQCMDHKTGKIGCFMYEVTRHEAGIIAESPIFDNLGDLIKYRNTCFIEVDTICGNPYLPIFERIEDQ